MRLSSFGRYLDHVWQVLGSREALFDCKEKPFQLVERSVPALLVAAAALLVAQARMRECQFGSLGNGTKPDLDKRLAGILGAARPAPTHAQPLGFHDFEIFAAALMLASIEHAEAYPEAATNLRVGLRHKHGAAVGAPPAGNAF